MPIVTVDLAAATVATPPAGSTTLFTDAGALKVKKADGAVDVITEHRADNLTGDTLAAGITASSLTSVGTLETLEVAGAISASNFSGSNTGDQTIELTGDVTGTGTGTFAATLGAAGTAGTYKSVTTDSKGRVIEGTNPTTLSGYGITDAVNISALGAASGVATLDVNGKLPFAQIPAIAVTDTFVVASQVAQVALTAEVGDVAVRTDLSKSFILKTEPASTFENWEDLLTPTSPVSSVNGMTGSVTVSTITGNAGTATALQTSRNINGVAFDGTGNITVAAAAGTLTGAALASGVTGSSLTSVGTLTSLAVAGAITQVTDLTTSGNVGIGATPTAKLFVQDTAPFSVVNGTGATAFGYKIQAGSTDVVVDTYNASTGENRIGGVQSYVYSTFWAGNAERMKIDTSGIVSIVGDTLRVSTQKTPASATAAGVKGDIVHDTDFIYVCTAANTWKRAALSTW